jgi:hypothetical protein
VSATPGCPLASGTLSGATLGLIRLGMTRAQARKAYPLSTNHHSKYQDFFCLTPIGVRVGYPSPKLLRTMAPRRRSALTGRVVWASTANPYYTLRGVSPRATLAAARAHLKLGKPFHIGANTWYLIPSGASTGVLKVRKGIVEEIGIAEKPITKTRKADRVFLGSFA